MSDEMEAVAFKVALQALDKFNYVEDMAVYIRNQFEKRYYLHWNCIIVDYDFAFSVRNEPNHYIYFSIGEKYFLLFKSPE
jgi:dynein light chain LC8-type